MTMDDEKIIGVDEAFESFVKKKLKQLGIKRSRSKSPDAMSKLEMRLKLRLEKNLAKQNSSGVVPMETKSDNTTQYSKIKAEASNAKKISPEGDSVTSKSFDVSRRLHGSNSSSDTVTSHAKKNNCDNFLNPKTISKEAVAAASEHSSSNIVINHAETNSLNHEATHSRLESVTSASKKDISIIKKKIELLKARSAEAKLKQELDGTLMENTTEVSKSEKKDPKMSANNLSLENSKVSLAEISSSQLKLEKPKTESLENNSSKVEKHGSEKHRIMKHSRSRRHSNSRSTSPSSKRRRRRRRSRSHSRRRRSRSRDRHRKKSKRSRSPRRISTKDKIRLLEIAKANALAQHRANQAASNVTNIGQIVKEGTMSVSQLTDLCQDISSEKRPEKVAKFETLSKKDAEKLLQTRESSTVHHPFLTKDTPINIRPVKTVPRPLPAPPIAQKPIETLSKEFPVSCGQHHRKKEVMEAVYGKWEAVAKDETTKQVMKEIVTSDNVFVQPEKPNLDLSTAIAERISAVRELQKNPNDSQAMDKIETTQKVLNNWSQSKQIIGQFTGDTRLTALPKNVLEMGTPAWFKAENLKNAKPVVGIGKSLLQKMGWKPGMCLGKSMPGQLEPLEVEFKTDRRGLSSFMEAPAPIQSRKSKKGGNTQISLDLSNKHPVSALTEVCSKRHWPPPEFRLVDPLNLTLFTFRVIVCNDEYMGKPAPNKKEAKKKAATVALQNMGLVRKT